ncbi:death domain-containing protein CRADD [Pseudochaenichthys georgianus]|uniref:death domain-containing protein CRADD n=1 Tax=Pseudochaenichthys georgianus TaxID=52239 RepID=UPI001469C340|nr:death domain-containing protein CRADD [Pseudochaenichthys georgianus]
MEPAHRALLREHRHYLSGQLLVSDSIVPLLFQEEILTEAQVDQILSQPSERLKALELLTLLPARGPRAFRAFIRSLEDHSWVRERLEAELQEVDGARGAGRDTGEHRISRPEPALANRLTTPTSLQTPPSDRVLSRLAARLGSGYQEVLLDLGLSAEDVFRCRTDNPLCSHSAVLAGLVLWRQRGGRGATMRRLEQSLEAAEVHPSVLQGAL